MKKRVFTFLKILLVLALTAMVCAGFFVTRIIRKAPQISTLDAVPKGYRTSILDDEGNVALTLADETSNRVYVKLADIPLTLQEAFIAIEDERFYEHRGVDLRGVARAFVRGVANGGFTEGASTITQQLLKNNVFEGWTEEVTFRDRLERKIQEQALAVALEMKVSKEWILENYLNTINLGGGNLGAETAARYYFDKDVTDLTLSESAVLACIPKSPSAFNPALHPEENAARRLIVLEKMLEQGYISQEEYDEAVADPVYKRIANVRENGTSIPVMDYFQDALVYEVLGDLMKQYGLTEEEAWDRLYTGGLTIESSQSSSLQALCEEAAENEELLEDGVQLSLVAIDNPTGAVKAMVGGRGEKDASLTYNRATSALRQPGSTIKIVGEYAAGMEARTLTLGTVVDDAPYTYSDGTSVHNWNQEYGGRTTVREAIAMSNNVVALKCFQMAGMDAVYDQLLSFGITTLTDADKVEALALGGTSGGVTNLEMTAAYATIARGGLYCEPTYYTRVYDREGNVLLENIPRSCQAVSPDTALLLTEALEDAITDGPGSYAWFEGMSLAGKSGTTTDVRDAWYIGFSPYITLGAWGGYDNNEAQESSTYIQDIWKSVMETAHETKEDIPFEGPDDQVKCFICTKCGNLAVEGLCDRTEQGDMTAAEYFVPGTEPTRPCTCHVEVTLCAESHAKAGRYCKQKETAVYLKEATPGTEDEDYVLPESAKHTCEQHKSFLQSLFGGNSGSSGSGGGLFGGNSGSGSSGTEDDGIEYGEPDTESDMESDMESDTEDEEDETQQTQTPWWSFLFGG